MSLEKCTDGLIERVSARVENGTPPRIACQAESIASSTYYAWLKRAEAEDGQHRKLVESLARAEAVLESRLLDEIRAGVLVSGRGDWKAKQQLLKNLFPERYSEEIKVTVKQQAAEELLDRLREGLDPGTFSQVLGCLMEEGGAEPEG